MHSPEERGTVVRAGGQKTVGRLIVGLILMVVSVGGCSYPQQRWDNYKKYIRQSIETPLTEGGRCEKQGGLSHGGKCYESSYADFDQNNCRLRGGLFIEEECYFPENDRIVIE